MHFAIEKCSHRKNKGKLHIMPTQKCTEIFQNVLRIDDGIVCAGGEVPYDTCAGTKKASFLSHREFDWLIIDFDSAGNIGAPLMMPDNATGQWTQIGMIVRRESCERIGIPGLYTHVKMYVDWILENMEGRNVIILWIWAFFSFKSYDII